MTIALRHGIFSNFKRKNCLKDYYHFQIHLRYCLLVVVALYILNLSKSSQNIMVCTAATAV